MKLFFDARYIRTDGRHDGISRYSTELANALSTLMDVTFVISDIRQLEFLPNGSKHVQIHSIDSFLEPCTSLRLNRYRPDVVFSPMQTIGSLGRRFKLIITLHDLIYYKHRLPPPSAKGLVRPLWRLFHLWYWPQRLVLNRADIVATVSRTSQQEIESVNLTKRPLIVISNAARDLTPLLKGLVRQTETPPQNLIFMGTPLPYKNIETLIRMMAWLPGRRLHVLSRISSERKRELGRLIPEGSEIIFHNGVDDEEYANLLANDALMVSASLAEGYGLPLAEALQLGVPAVVSDRPFFREVAGDGATYADPTDPEIFALAVQSLDPLAVRVHQIARGRRHIGSYSWLASAAELKKAAERLLNDK